MLTYARLFAPAMHLQHMSSAYCNLFILLCCGSAPMAATEEKQEECKTTTTTAGPSCSPDPAAASHDLLERLLHRAESDTSWSELQRTLDIRAPNEVHACLASEFVCTRVKTTKYVDDDDDDDEDDDDGDTNTTRNKGSDEDDEDYDGDKVWLVRPATPVEEPLRVVSFARLDDQEGMQVHLELLPSQVTFRFVTECIAFFCGAYEMDERWNKKCFKRLERELYVVHMTGKYYHFVAALDYMEFELESKGMGGGVFRWKRHPLSATAKHADKVEERIVYNITDTGDHMWYDDYSLRCTQEGCFMCAPSS